MRTTLADDLRESRICKTVLHHDYSEFPDELRQLIELAEYGFGDPANREIMCGYRAAKHNGGNIMAHMEVHAATLAIYQRPADRVESPSEILPDVRRLLNRAAKEKIAAAHADIEVMGESSAFGVLGRLQKNELPAQHIVATDAIPWDELNKPVSYENNLIGDRFLEKGQALLLYGPAGCGKSVAGLQCCVEWAAGIDAFHLPPVRPLRVVIIQTEDSLDDQREALAGIRSASYLTPDHQALIEKNLIILPAISGGNPEALARVMESAAERHGPDVINVNPLLAFCPGDPARELGGILYQVIDPILKRHNVGFLGVHHTPKTNNRDTSGYGRHDWQYLAAGDARVANWPRAMMQIEEAKYPVYKFHVTKRGQRTGWTWDQKPTNELHFRHCDGMVRWADAMPEEIATANNSKDYTQILEILPPQSESGISRERMQQLAKSRLNAGKSRADAWLKLANEDGEVETISERTKSNRVTHLFRRSA